jgi:ribosome recycling factor
MSEDGKVAVRNIRKDVLKKLDKYDFPKVSLTFSPLHLQLL